MSRLPALAAAAIVLIAGLVVLGESSWHPLIPASALRPSRPSASPSRSPAGPAGPVLGVDLYAAQDYPAAQVAQDGRRDLAYIAGTLHAQSVGIVWNLYSPERNSDSVTGYHALSATNVATLTRIAEADHLSVQYRPLVRIGPAARWEGYLDPASQQAWFGSFYRVELPYLRDAQRLGVGEFVVATEMRALTASPLWPAFFRRVAGVYHGLVSYASNDTDFFPVAHRHILSSPGLGATAYPDVDLPAGASTAQLTTAWERYLGQVPEAVLHRTAIDEIGIPAIAGAYRKPWNWLGLHGPLDEQVQARWFTAACTAVARDHMRAIYFYNVNLTDNPASPPYPSPTTFEGKPGATAIRNCRTISGRSFNSIPIGKV